jgi:iron(III) transport system substrate-binding protein
MHRGEDVNFVYFAEGTPVITDSIAIMKDARHREEALAFVDFVLSRKVQSYMVERFYLRSIRQDVDVPLGLVPMDQINIFSASDLTTYDEKERILNRWIQLEREAGIE